MKRSLTLIISALIVLILIRLGLSASTQADHLSLLNIRKIDVEATAQAIQLQHQQVVLEAAAHERFQALQNEITQKEQVLDRLNQTNEDQVTQLTAQLTALKTQVQQFQSQNQQLQATVTHLRNSIEEDNRNHQAALATAQSDIQQQEAQLRQELRVVSDQLQTAFNNLTTPEAAFSSSGLDAGEQDSNGEDGQNQPENHKSDDNKEEENHHENNDD